MLREISTLKGLTVGAIDGDIGRSTTCTLTPSTGRSATSWWIPARGCRAAEFSSRRCRSMPRRGGRRPAERGPHPGPGRAGAELGYRQAGVPAARDRARAALRLPVLLDRPRPLGSRLGSPDRRRPHRAPESRRGGDPRAGAGERGQQPPQRERRDRLLRARRGRRRRPRGGLPGRRADLGDPLRRRGHQELASRPQGRDRSRLDQERQLGGVEDPRGPEPERGGRGSGIRPAAADGARPRDAPVRALPPACVLERGGDRGPDHAGGPPPCAQPRATKES